jgi:hypothetical protein
MSSLFLFSDISNIVARQSVLGGKNKHSYVYDISLNVIVLKLIAIN